MHNGEIQPYSRCRIPSGVEPALSSSQLAAATHHQTADQGQLDSDTGRATQGADNDASDRTLNSPAHTHPPYRGQIKHSNKTEPPNHSSGSLDLASGIKISFCGVG